ncbi:MAG: LysE family translocator [Desulforegulaceae bacterium]|nr:LysE family translocator [Desulforegulaceae bacterium]
MLTPDVFITFFAASTILALAPGPDNIFVLTQSAIYGRLSGIFVTLGLCTGLIFHTTAVALGVAVIFKTSIIAFNILKYAGAAYLLYLAWMSFKAGSTEIINKEQQKLPFSKLYKRGIIMNITNPKVSIFFLAFLPQFASPERGLVSLQIISLGLIFILATIIVFGSIAFLSGTIGTWFSKSAKAQSILNKTAAAVFFALALKLAIIKQ